MSIKNLLKEGILDPSDEGVQVLAIPADEGYYKKFYDKIEQEVKNNVAYQAFKDSQLPKLYEMAMDDFKEEDYQGGKFYYDELIDLVREYQDEIKRTIEKISSKRVRVKFKLSIHPSELRDIYKPLTNGSFQTVNTKDYNSYDNRRMSKRLSRIEFEFNFITLMYSIYKNKFKDYKNDFLSTAQHELVHAVQKSNLGDGIMDLGRVSSRGSNTMQSYAGSDLEIPAWSKTIAHFYYLEADSKASIAIRNFKQGKNIAPTGSNKHKVIKYIFDGIRSGDHKSKKLAKYVFLYLEKMKTKDPEDIEVEDVTT